jgi:demethylmenaquinone methyltransferase/2-methoxy-6-polyprenyl-1,4-benzoquinol methylase
MFMTHKSNTPPKVHAFGFQNVEPEEKTQMVQAVFDKVANKYDIMNDLMSLTLHRKWKDHFVNLVAIKPNFQHLDMAGGTGDISERIRQKLQKIGLTGTITLCDLNYDMLSNAHTSKNVPLGPQPVCANAEVLPFCDEAFDAYTIAFGIRNVTHIEAALAQAYRVLKPGGQFLCLEFSKVTSPILSAAYKFYTLKCIPKLGKLMANDEASYQYLAESIDQFMPPFTLKEKLSHAGFKNVTYTHLTGGIVAIHCGWK